MDPHPPIGAPASGNATGSQTGPDSLWSAPVATKPVSGTVVVPGSKSQTNRALILGSLSTTPTEIVNPLISRDSTLMEDALRTLGAQVESNDSGQLLVTRDAAYVDDAEPRKIDCGLAGTVMRFVPPRAALSTGAIDFDGDEQAYARPMKPLLDAMGQIGMTLDPPGARRLPFRLNATGQVAGGTVQMDASSSSQFVSGLLLSAPAFDHGVHIVHTGVELPSFPHILMTIDMLANAGISAVASTDDSGAPVFSVEPGEVRLDRVVVEPDLSNAAAFLAAAMVTGGQVSIPHWPTETTQPGDQIRTVFEQMGATIEITDGVLTLTGPEKLTGYEGDLRDIGELVPTVAAVAAVAANQGSGSNLTGIAHLRGHETDRIHALSTELKRAGLKVLEREDGIEILPSFLKAADFSTYHDHRMATFGAILGLVTEGTRVENIETTSKTLPDFANTWTDLVSA